MLRVGAGVGLALILVACSQPASPGPTRGSARPSASLASSGGLTGRVVDADGHGIAGVTVVALPKPDASQARPPAVETGADGTFRFGALAAGRWHVAVMAGETEVAATDVDVPQAGDATVTIVMEGP